MDGYYDYQPTCILGRPICVVGFMGARHEHAAAQASRLTGLRFVGLQQAVEHRAGCSVARLVLDEGEASFRRQESAALHRSLREKPHGIIALGEGTLMSPENRQAVLSGADLVYVHYPAEELLGRIRAQVEQAPGRYFPWIPQEAISSDLIQALLSSRLPGYQHAPYVIDAAGRSSAAVTMELLDRFELR